MFVEVHRRYTSGDVVGARNLFARYVPTLVLALRSIDIALWTAKELLRRRGVLSEAHLRAPCEVVDAGFVAELDASLADLERWGERW
jgi:hypothetical protein